MKHWSHQVEVDMLLRSAFLACAAGTFALAVSPAMACEMHQHHSTSIIDSTSVSPPQPSIEPQLGTAIVLPSAAAAMSVAEELGTGFGPMRCLERKSEQALTQ
jgi:hypothetical protein